MSKKTTAKRKENIVHIALYKFAISACAAFNALIGRPKISFESENVNFKNLPARLLIVSNHTYWLDPANLSVLFRQRLVNPVAAKEVFENGRAPLMKSLRCIPLDRTTMDLACIKECVARLLADQRVVIFPEGQLNLTDEILEFKAGAALIAMQSKCHVVPVFTSGVYKPFGGLRIVIGDPISFEELFQSSMGAAGVTHASELMQIRMQRLSDKMLSEMSQKEKDKRQAYRDKFAEKRIKATENK